MLQTRSIPNRTTILMYHGIPETAESHDALDGRSFEKQIAFLKQHADFIHPRDLYSATAAPHRPRLLLTFDDGMRNQCHVAAPILRKYHVPALFFASTYHSQPGRYLWFNYFRALVRYYPHHVLLFRGDTFDMSPARRINTIQSLMSRLLAQQPHPQSIYSAIENEMPDLAAFAAAHALQDQAAGMSMDDLQDLASDPLFTLALHTHHHALLIRCSDDQIRSELAQNEAILKSAGATDLLRVAYPCGVADVRVKRACAAFGIQQGFAAGSRREAVDALSVPRVGIYKRSTLECLLKLFLADRIDAPWLWPVRRCVASLRFGFTSPSEQVSFRA